MNCRIVNPETCIDLKPLSANPTKWSNTLKQFVENSQNLNIRNFSENYFLALPARVMLLKTSTAIELL